MGHGALELGSTSTLDRGRYKETASPACMLGGGLQKNYVMADMLAVARWGEI